MATCWRLGMATCWQLGMVTLIIADNFVHGTQWHVILLTADCKFFKGSTTEQGYFDPRRVTLADSKKEAFPSDFEKSFLLPNSGQAQLGLPIFMIYIGVGLLSWK